MFMSVLGSESRVWVACLCVCSQVFVFVCALGVLLFAFVFKCGCAFLCIFMCMHVYGPVFVSV